MLKLEPFTYQEIFKISLLSIVQKILFFLRFWLIFCPLDPDPWIRIFLQILIQEAKILRTQRILSTAGKYYDSLYFILFHFLTFPSANWETGGGGGCIEYIAEMLGLFKRLKYSVHNV